MFSALHPLLPVGSGLPVKRRLLRHCEAAVRGLGQGESPQRLAQRLFLEVRPMVAPADALTALQVVEGQVRALHHAVLRARVAPITRCAAANRRGRRCGRDAVRGATHCASHRHLAEGPHASPAAAVA
jgi:hypothetical protein